MISKYEITATSDEVKKIKKEVYGLSQSLKINVKSIKGYVEPKKVFISINEGYGMTLDLKIEALKELKKYCDSLRMRMFEGKLI